MAVTADRAAPYAPATAIMALIDRHRNKGLPSPVDADVLARAGISGSLIPRTLQALQTLDLIGEDGRPSHVMEGLRLAPEAEFKTRLTEWLNAAYADALSYVDPAIDDEVRIRDAFRSYSPVGQQSRMVTLFIGLFAAAGVAPDKQRAAPRKPTKPASINNGTQTRRQKVVVKSGGNPTVTPPRQPAIDLPPAIMGLLTSLPASGQSWSKVERDRFVVTFGAVLDFCFPVETRPKPKSEPEKSEEEDRE